jgi:hypothetical protein
LPRVDYYAYIASREWGVRKRKIRDRNGGRCERCGGPQEAVHHLTYEHLGDEPLDELLAVCRRCHAYLGGHTDEAPPAERRLFPPLPDRRCQVCPHFSQVPRPADLCLLIWKRQQMHLCRACAIEAAEHSPLIMFYMRVAEPR